MSRIDGPDPNLLNQLKDSQMQEMLQTTRRIEEQLRLAAEERESQAKMILEMLAKFEKFDGTARAG